MGDLFRCCLLLAMSLTAFVPSHIQASPFRSDDEAVHDECGDLLRARRNIVVELALSNDPFFSANPYVGSAKIRQDLRRLSRDQMKNVARQIDWLVRQTHFTKLSMKVRTYVVRTLVALYKYRSILDEHDLEKLFPGLRAHIEKVIGEILQSHFIFQSIEDLGLPERVANSIWASFGFDQGKPILSVSDGAPDQALLHEIIHYAQVLSRKVSAFIAPLDNDLWAFETEAFLISNTLEQLDYPREATEQSGFSKNQQMVGSLNIVVDLARQKALELARESLSKKPPNPKLSDRVTYLSKLSDHSLETLLVYYKVYLSIPRVTLADIPLLFSAGGLTKLQMEYSIFVNAVYSTRRARDFLTDIASYPQGYLEPGQERLLKEFIFLKFSNLEVFEPDYADSDVLAVGLKEEHDRRIVEKIRDPMGMAYTEIMYDEKTVEAVVAAHIAGHGGLMSLVHQHVRIQIQDIRDSVP